MSVLIHYSIEAAPISIIVYAVIWRLMSKRDGRRLQLDRMWHIAGGAATALGTGAARLASAYVLGGSVMQELWTNQGIGLIGPVGVPVVLAVGVVAFLRTKAAPRVSPRNAD
ncbi:MAG: hypothetical protein HY655_12105 [Acidobacteria bacterium]|nr:hypothetical protein [Acidobacteriota bacterium]